MYYENSNLPADVHEVFFSDVYYYASSAVRTAQGRPRFVGCGTTREKAFADLRQEAANAEREATARQAPPPTSVAVDEMVLLSEDQRHFLALNLVRIRQARKVTQLYVAQHALGFEKSHAAVSRMERGELRHVPRTHLERLADFYATTVVALLHPAQH